MTGTRASSSWGQCRAPNRAKPGFTTPIRRTASGGCGVALWDVLRTCEIEGAADAAIRSPEPNDLPWLLAQAEIRAIFATGAKAAELYQKLILPQTGRPIVRLPSTSPANAAWTLERLIEKYMVINDFL